MGDISWPGAQSSSRVPLVLNLHKHRHYIYLIKFNVILIKGYGFAERFVCFDILYSELANFTFRFQ